MTGGNEARGHCLEPLTLVFDGVDCARRTRAVGEILRARFWLCERRRDDNVNAEDYCYSPEELLERVNQTCRTHQVFVMPDRKGIVNIVFVYFVESVAGACTCE